MRWAHPAWTEQLGWSPDELRAAPPFSLVHEDDHAATAALLSEVVAGCDAVAFTNRVRDRSGGWRWLEWHARLGSDGAIYARAEDVTLRQERDIALQSRLHQLQLAEEIAQIGYWRLDLGAQRLDWSRKVCEIHGRDPALGAPPLDSAIEYYHPDDRGRVEQALERTIDTGAPFSFELRLLRDDGAVRRVESNGRAELSPTGEVHAINGVFRDITARSIRHRRAEHTERLAAIGELAGGVAHEVNNPLTYVRFNAEVLIEELQTLGEQIPADQHALMLEMARDIQEGSHRIAAIVESMRAFSPETRPLATEPLPVAAAVEQALRAGDPGWRDPARLQVDLPDTLPLVRAHHGRLPAALGHLISNALLATPPAGDPVRVYAEVTGDQLHLRVCDSGEGMAPDVLRQAEQPFFSTRKGEGATGLGLFITHAFAAAMGGELRLRSTPGQGTTATLTLQVDRRAPHAARTPHRPAHVLLVDPEPRVLRATARALSGHRVTALARIDLALEELADDPSFDVVLVDIDLPEVRSGAFLSDLPDALRARTWLMSAGAPKTADEDQVAAVGGRLLTKPIDRARLWAAISVSLSEDEG